MNSPKESRIATSKRWIWRALGLSLGMLAAGTVASLAGAEGNGFTWYGWAGVVVLFSGLGLALVVVYWQGRIEKKELANPKPSDEPGAVDWMSNPYPYVMARRERRWRLALIPVVAWMLANWALILLAPAFPTWLMVLTVGLGVLSFFPFAACLTNGVLGGSRFCPARVGLSSRGIHAEYDPVRLQGRPLPPWAPTYVPWAEVGSLSAPAYRGSTHQLFIRRIGGGRWLLDGLEPNIIARVLSAWDAGPNFPLTSSGRLK